VPIKLHHRRDQVRIEANAEQRRREDAAPRLCDEIRGLKTLRIHFEDRRNAGQLTAMSYSKPIVVTSAPCMFEIRCMEPRCDGLHDITHEMMSNLRKQLTKFDGESACNGAIGDLGCDRVLAFSCVATYA
jgi:hypothetical protein